MTFSCWDYLSLNAGQTSLHPWISSSPWDFVLVNFLKSCLRPSTSCKYLDFIFHSIKQSISIPRRRENLRDLTTKIARLSKCPIRLFASFIGSLISVCPAVQYGLLYTKSFEKEAALKPQRPRYDFIWNPAPVIAKLASIYPYEGIPLRRITTKLVLLLALGMGQRAAIRLSQISISEKIIIRCPDRTKTSAPGRYQPFFCFSRFLEQENLCIVRLTEHYIERTRALRPSSCDSLFISLSKPFRAVKAQTLSRWIKQGLREAGINTETFSVHSTRHASTSRAAQKGVSSDLIKRAAGWTGESRVFANFYNRPIINPEEYSNAVLLI
ncbi:hypothetical protein ALC60_00382 [Trachymyrmex zeteki]|uniref:Tyr recombinase domain-containing protein n=1 Tax=Mycetomoellerius zeteki TaxID=64791 RepID=A0A151XJG4_9HYME|nr:hypothetical protein ALC60_00382 [Trachymyrmex zeteki]